MNRRWVGLFWNAEERRLRGLWRLLAFTAAFVLASALWGYVLHFTGPWFSRLRGGVLRHVFPLSPGYMASVMGLMSALLLCSRICDRRPLADYGFHFSRRWWQDLAAGAGMATAGMLAAFLTALFAGWVHVEAVAWQDPRTWLSLGGWAIGFLLVGLQEETLVRGYLLRNLAESLAWRFWGPRGGVIAAWVISSSLFGVLHLGNPHATWRSAVLITIGGLWMGLAYVLSGELALPIGIHTAWNFVQGPVLGFRVSGLDITPYPLLRPRVNGPEVWTGGPFGPEAGLLSGLAVGVGLILLFLWARRQGYTFRPDAFRPPSRTTTSTADAKHVP